MKRLSNRKDRRIVHRAKSQVRSAVRGRAQLPPLEKAFHTLTIRLSRRMLGY